ncbi:MAG: anaerobic ribonucleoside-triphosphate reductase activating protein [Opitutales bacterium]|nr:anaerobic ribonucleoside-triphosphate reductase activating protein [Opitutales bacterium]
MKAGALVKTTLIDYPGHIASVVFCQGCPWRCPFCHNPELVLPECMEIPIPEDVVFRELVNQKESVDAVVLSGGEILTQRDVAIWVERIHAMGLKVKIDTNGYYPDRMMSLFEKARPDYVAMDIKTDAAGYDKLVGKKGAFGRVRESISILASSGVDHEFRTTLIEGYHLPSRLLRLFELVPNTSRYYLQAFRPASVSVGDWSGYEATSPEYIRLAERLAKDFGLCVKIRNL